MKNEHQNKVKNDIDDDLKSKEKAFVLFYASWCPTFAAFLADFSGICKKQSETMHEYSD